VTVGIIGGVIGIHRSLGFSAIALLVVTASLFAFAVQHRSA
jgi:hypothetical protein